MRCLLLLLFSASQIVAQNLLEKTWIGPHNEVVDIRKDTIYFYYCDRLKHHYFELDSNTVEILDYICPGKTSDDYDIDKLTSDSLVIVPKTKDDGDELMVSRELRLVDARLLYDSSVVFDSVYFSGLGMQISFTSSGDVRFIGGWYTKPYIGCFVGQLPEQWITQFTELLRKSNIKAIPGSLAYLPHIPVYQLVLTCNGETIHTEGCVVPPFNWALVDTLRDCYKKANLVKVDTVIFDK